MSGSENNLVSSPDKDLIQLVNSFRQRDDFIDRYLIDLVQMINDLDRNAIWTVTQVLMEAWQRGSTVFIMGNGGSAATASHMANDLNKFTVTPGKKRFRAIALTDNIPWMTALGNDDSYESIFSEQVINLVDPGDVLIAISASGNSPNVLRAVEVGRQLGAVTIAFTGDTGGRLKDLVDHFVLAPSPKIGPQEDCHMILDHVISNTLKPLINET